MKIVNIFGGPGIGKTHQARKLFVEMDIGLKGTVDIINEFAKTLVYKDNLEVLKRDQVYVFGNQQHDYVNMISGDKVQYAIAECPLPMNIIYNRIAKDKGGSNYNNNPFFKDFIMYEYNKYDNINIFLKRETKYDTSGRYQDEKGAIEVDNYTKEVLAELGIEYTEVGLENFCENVMKLL
jgi:hypothetical protein